MQINWNTVRIFIKPGVTDMRKQINGLAIINIYLTNFYKYWPIGQLTKKPARAKCLHDYNYDLQLFDRIIKIDAF